VVRFQVNDVRRMNEHTGAQKVTTHSINIPDALRCAACGALLIDGYYFIHGRRERYCARCIRERDRCDVCSAPLGDRYWTLHDGRRLCETCHATAIYDPSVAQQLFNETVAAIVAQLGMALRVGVDFRLVDAPTLAAVRAQDKPPQPGEAPALGLYQRHGRLRVIYMLYGLPKLLFRTVVAHEYAHAWQGENCPLLSDHDLIEGFAEWVAYHHLGYLGSHKAAAAMRESNHPYRPLLERMLALEAQIGPAGVLEYMRRAGVR